MPPLLRLILLASLLAGSAGLAAAVPASERPGRVLLVTRAASAAPWSVQFTDALRGALLRSHSHARLDIELLTGSPPPTAPAEPPAWLLMKYAGRRYDVVVAAGAQHVAPAVAMRDRLWPQATVVVPTLDAQHAAALRHVPKLTGLVLPDPVAANLELMFRLLPDTRHIAVIASSLDADPIRPHWRRNLEQWRDRATVIDLSGLEMPALLRRVQTLPRNTVIYFAASGASLMSPRDLLLAVAPIARAPVFVDAAPVTGTGAVGGSVVSPEAAALDVALQIDKLLDGTAPELIGLQPHTPPRLQFDWRALQRWNIPLKRLPPGSEVQFQPPAIWQAYRGTVIIVLVVLLVQSALIALLVLERRRRRGAELRAHEHLRELARLNRTGAISALSAALAHEINQPLGAILSNAETAELLLESPQPRLGEVRELLAAIREDDQRAAAVLSRLRAWIAKSPRERERISLNLLAEDVARMLRPELRSREAELELQLEENLPDVLADPVQIQQVLLNLVINALDAMQNLPPRERCVTLRTSRNPAGAVDVRVIDHGPGLAGVPAERLFEPFFTTKPQGLGVGLSISRSIIEYHGGSVQPEVAAERGAVFRVTLPAAEGKFP